MLIKLSIKIQLTKNLYNKKNKKIKNTKIQKKS